MLQPIRMEHYFDPKGSNIKDGVQDGRPSVRLLRPIWSTYSNKKTLILTFYECLEAKLYKRSYKNMVLIQKVEILKMASKMAVC